MVSFQIDDLVGQTSITLQATIDDYPSLWGAVLQHLFHAHYSNPIHDIFQLVERLTLGDIGRIPFLRSTNQGVVMNDATTW
ncbi:hypothetical protein D3C84_993380 [compost metagenome]